MARGFAPTASVIPPRGPVTLQYDSVAGLRSIWRCASSGWPAQHTRSAAEKRAYGEAGRGRNPDDVCAAPVHPQPRQYFGAHPARCYLRSRCSFDTWPKSIGTMGTKVIPNWGGGGGDMVTQNDRSSLVSRRHRWRMGRVNIRVVRTAATGDAGLRREVCNRAGVSAGRIALIALSPSCCTVGVCRWSSSERGERCVFVESCWRH